MLKKFLARLLTFALVVMVSFTGLTACSGTSASGLTGKYVDDTLLVVENLTTAIQLPADAPNRTEVQEAARLQMNEYTSRYRRDPKTSGLRSFTTMQTALNALAGYYSSFGSRPLPEKLKTRLTSEFEKANLAVKRGI
ncbi:photosystem II 11 kD protein [[Synechococcus] sp. NIES-970]|uniref:photosystem II protein Psb27 n=1 Tax=Picosynechococcus sp. NKBG15041c TaxID=1407650 RepID=UPI000409DF55|nr:photosystem II protein Psb27 [Picosynechococcus sp. NKBG15041c]BAW97643.1 photosystem II 11 kD protein [[Synechococcus] sp. NIES-970]